MISNGDGFYPRVFGLVAAALLAYLLFRILQLFIGPILWSVLLAFLLFPLNHALRRAVGGRATLAAGLLTVGVVLVLIGPAAAVVVAFTRQSGELFARFQRAADRYHMTELRDLLRVPVVEQTMAWLASLTPITGEQIEAWAVSAAQAMLWVAVSASGVVVVEAVGGLVALIVMLFLLFFFLRDGQEIVQRSLVLVPMAPERRGHLVEHLAAVTRAVVFGSLLTALIQGTLVGIAFALAKLPSPVVFGALAAVASLVPLVGSALVWVPAALVLVFQGRWGAAIFVALWCAILVSSADNLVRPLFISGRAQISTLPVFLGLTGGVSAFGPIGIVLGPVIIALTLALLRYAEQSQAGDEMAKTA